MNKIFLLIGVSASLFAQTVDINAIRMAQSKISNSGYTNATSVNERKEQTRIKIEKPIGYSISKSGTLNLTRFLATKFAENNIRVNTMTLGGVYDNNPTEFVKSYAERTPLGRMANKTEYAGPLLFLASDMSSYMTGSNLIVDGGWTAW